MKILKKKKRPKKVKENTIVVTPEVVSEPPKGKHQRTIELSKKLKDMKTYVVAPKVRSKLYAQYKEAEKKERIKNMKMAEEEKATWKSNTLQA